MPDDPVTLKAIVVKMKHRFDRAQKEVNRLKKQLKRQSPKTEAGTSKNTTPKDGSFQKKDQLEVYCCQKSIQKSQKSFRESQGDEESEHEALVNVLVKQTTKKIGHRKTTKVKLVTASTQTIIKDFRSIGSQCMQQSLFRNVSQQVSPLSSLHSSSQLKLSASRSSINKVSRAVSAQDLLNKEPQADLQEEIARLTAENEQLRLALQVENSDESELKTQLRQAQEEVKEYMQELDRRDLEIKKNYEQSLYEKECLKSSVRMLEAQNQLLEQRITDLLVQYKNFSQSHSMSQLLYSDPSRNSLVEAEERSKTVQAEVEQQQNVVIDREVKIYSEDGQPVEEELQRTVTGLNRMGTISPNMKGEDRRIRSLGLVLEEEGESGKSHAKEDESYVFSSQTSGEHKLHMPMIQIQTRDN